MTRSKTAPEIETEALTWLWKRESGVWTPELEREFQLWLNSQTACQGAYVRAEALWVQLESVPSEAIKPLAANDVPQRPLVHDRRFILGGGAAIAAGLAAALLLPKGKAIQTAIGEIKTVPLEDGSYLSLNTNSRVQVVFDERSRRLTLDAGETWVKVEPNPQRPFIVEAGRVRVQAVGTAFAVKREKDSTKITVTEGRVAVWIEGVPGSKQIIHAGDILQASEITHAVTPERPMPNVERQLAWRQGKIELEGETLSDAIVEFNRYNHLKLVLKDPALSQQQLYGVFDSRDPMSFAKSIGLTMKTSVHQDQDEIQIGSR